MLKRTDLFPAKVKVRWVKRPSLYFLLFGIAIVGFGTVTVASQSHGQHREAKDVSASSEPNLDKTVAADGKVAKKLNQTLEDNHFSGTALVVKNGKVLLHEGYGKANVQKNRSNNPKTTFPIASTAKILTAILVGQSVDAGKLSYDSKLSDYYPNVPNADQITIRDLLTMTSGLKQSKQPEEYSNDMANVDFSAANAESSGGVIGTGDGWSYQPINYRLLAGILMKVTGKSYQELCQQIFNHNAKLGISYYPAFKQAANLANAYQVGTDSERDVTAVEYQRETGTGNVAMTTGQLYQLYRLFFTNKLTKNHQDLMVEHLPAHYASGLYGYGSVYEGHGIFSGYESNVVVSNQGKDAVILLSNQYDKEHSFQKVGQEAFSQLTGKEAP
ncbi:serine hydrolase domain-containing protein [Fructobacillus fructosus]|uniref:serine hydrolase domain-containing protein n=1 Tax=Fructobacillus fructosus TaxID=1631 RepID=UPI002D85EAA0|nr:CubicO group peptidase [Fructobacillus fructosus]CAK1237639.1 CubicO group peptidase [Fructobacillus fructosus]CAK1238892.1 CubicO group peptidase [Fructobacillus fructosus]